MNREIIKMDGVFVSALLNSLELENVSSLFSSGVIISTNPHMCPRVGVKSPHKRSETQREKVRATSLSFIAPPFCAWPRFTTSFLEILIVSEFPIWPACIFLRGIVSASLKVTNYHDVLFPDQLSAKRDKMHNRSNCIFWCADEEDWEICCLRKEYGLYQHYPSNYLRIIGMGERRIPSAHSTCQ